VSGFSGHGVLDVEDEAMDDRALLRRFVQDGDEQAFAELVRRHIDLVYAASRRQLRDPAAIEDATQSVFVLLSKKAHTIRDSEALAGWLLVATRCVVLNMIRTETRRRKHEGRAAEMKQELQADAPEQWESIRPMLDQAVSTLKHQDRDAITLRYFKGQSVGDVAAALGISQDAAQKRVLRAVDRLRDFFARHGVTTSSDALATALVGNLLIQAPAQLSAHIAAAALAAGNSGATLGISKTAATFMAGVKAKAAVAVTAAVVLAGTAAPLVQHLTHSTVTAQLQQPPAAAPTPAQPTATAAQPAELPVPDWLIRINEVYGLSDGQVFKRVVPPFIPERAKFVEERIGDVNRRAGAARAGLMQADAAVFIFDGKAVRWTHAMRDTMDLGDVLKVVAKIWPQDTDIDRTLIATKVPGDFVVRQDTKPEDLLTALTASMPEVIGPAMVLRNEELEREVIVVRGTLKYTEPLKEPELFPTVYLFSGAVKPRTAFNMSVGQTPNEMLQIVGETMGRPMVVEAELSGKAAAVAMHQLADLRRSIGVADGKLVDDLLANLSKQTSLEFKRERRKVPTWRLIKQDL
jgi:RNA polymerase sigma factor (sigma-70 family)